MILDLYTIQELSSLHRQTGQYVAAMYARTIKLTYEMGTVTDADTYAGLRGVREVVFAAAREAEELMVEIGAEMKARDYRDAPDGH